jgi:hypothetical protein
MIGEKERNKIASGHGRCLHAKRKIGHPGRFLLFLLTGTLRSRPKKARITGAI